MSDYIILTDSGSDISRDVLAEWGVYKEDLVVRKKGETETHADGEFPVLKMYSDMRNGTVFQTSAVNAETFSSFFEDYLKQGTDILYLGFSSGLSATVASAAVAADELKEKYPERKLIVIDTLCASAGQGLIVYKSVQKKNCGASVEENAEYVRGLIPKLSHWFTVDDLIYLKRGGRISPAAAFAATALNIKPVMHVDDLGHLANVRKVRGRAKSVRGLFEAYCELADDPQNGEYFISHGDCIDDAHELESMIEERFGHKASLITYVGPVIGSHSGPGTLALFFVAKNR